MVVRHVRDPGIDVPAREPRGLPPSPVRGKLASVDAQAKQARIENGIKVPISFKIPAKVRFEIEEWAAETGKKTTVLLRELVMAALACREAGLSPTAVLADAPHKPRG